jgi:hypothetical protein
VIDHLFVGTAVGAVHVVRTEVQRNLAHFQALDHPVRLDVIEVVEHQACDSEHANVI